MTEGGRAADPLWVRTLLVAILLCLVPRAVSAQTVGSVATAGSACDSSGVQGIADQLVALQMCRMPGVFVPLTPHANVVLTSSHVHAVMNSMARDAIWSAAGSVELDFNSVFRSLAEQYVLYNRSSCLTPARPGTSSHESGRAADVNNYAAAGVISAMAAGGCTRTSPSADPVHFQCPGPDLSADNVRTFQHLWNINNPADMIAEDGAYGPMTESRLMASPAGGFAIATDCGTTCTPHCEGTVIVGMDCGRGDCAAFGAVCTDDTLGARCTSVFCATTGIMDVCLPDGRLGHCSDGALMSPTDCAAGTTCVAGGCVAPGVDAGVPPVDAGMTPVDLGMAMTGDSSVPVDAGDVDAPFAGDLGSGHHHASGGCGCRVVTSSGRGGWEVGLFALALLFTSFRGRSGSRTSRSAPSDTPR